MTTQWTRCAHIYVNASIIQAAKAKAQAIMPDLREERMFDAVRLSVSGNLPAQAYGCSTALKVTFVQRWKAEFIDLNPNNVRWYLMNLQGQLIATNSPTVNANKQSWTWQQSIDDIGLTVIESP